MKWKDSGELTDQEEKPKEEFFDEEHYSPWTTRKDSVKGGGSRKIPLVFILLGLAIVMSLAALLTLLMSSKGEGPGNKEYALLDDRIRQLEERLNKYEAIDEKVTRIWEQAKAFEKFQERFDRSEASASLRMDHITMSLEALQKQVADIQKASPPAAERKTSDKATSASAKKKSGDQAPATAAVKTQYHTIAAGDTFYSISKRYNISVEDLLKLNHIDKTSTLQLGQKLVVGVADTR